MRKNSSQKSVQVCNTCHKMVVRKFPVYKLKQKGAKKFENQNFLKSENSSTHHRREHNVSGTTQASFHAKFKATRNKLVQKRHR